jgi:hypothetical protein
MEIRGRIYRKLPLVTGEGTRGPWYRLEVVVEQPGQYEPKAVIQLTGDKARIADEDLKEGMDVTFHIGIEAREYEGKWYNSVKAWKYAIEGTAGGFIPPMAPPSSPMPSAPWNEPALSSPASPAPTAATPTTTATQSGDNEDDLPF